MPRPPRAAIPFASASAAASEPEGAAEPGRARHVVDRGLEYRALQRQGMTPLAIQRRKRKSKAYVSIVLRFGGLLETLDPLEIAVLRHPRVTFKLLQQVVRADSDDRQVVQRLRSAITMPKPDGRRRRRLKLQPAPPPADPDLFAFRWDAEWAARDPMGYLEALEAYLRRVQRGVDHRMKALLAGGSATASGSLPDARSDQGAVAPAAAVARGGGSLRAIQAALRQSSAAAGTYRPPPEGATERAVRGRLAALDEVLRRLERRVGGEG